MGGWVDRLVGRLVGGLVSECLRGEGGVCWMGY